ncbi:hypothetical protein C8R44DRAFT_814578, partial [Mycena epipterygia]
ANVNPQPLQKCQPYNTTSNRRRVIPALRPHHLQAPEYCAPGIRWFAVRRMRKDAEAKIVKKVIKSQQKK